MKRPIPVMGSAVSLWGTTTDDRKKNAKKKNPLLTSPKGRGTGRTPS